MGKPEVKIVEHALSPPKSPGPSVSKLQQRIRFLEGELAKAVERERGYKVTASAAASDAGLAKLASDRLTELNVLRTQLEDLPSTVARLNGNVAAAVKAAAAAQVQAQAFNSMLKEIAAVLNDKREASMQVASIVRIYSEHAAKQKKPSVAAPAQAVADEAKEAKVEGV